jgi:hypothetical protein
MLLQVGIDAPGTEVLPGAAEVAAGGHAEGDAGNGESGRAGRPSARDQRHERSRSRVSGSSSGASRGASSGASAEGAGEDGATADGEQSEADASAGGDESSGAGAEGEGGDEREVRGRIVDASSGEPVPDVRILVVRTGSGWRGTRGDENGEFLGIAPDPLEDDPDAPVELRVSAKGYVSQTVPYAGGEPKIELVKRDHPPVLGVVAGFATDPAGTVVSGRLLISGYDAMGDHFGQWAEADERGAFRLEGMPPGYWRLRAEGGDDWVEVLVPEGGETSAHLRTGDEPWPGTLTAEEYEDRHRALRTSGPRTSDAELGPDAERRAHWERILAVQDLECRWRGVRPRHEVVVTGLPDTAHAHLRAATTRGPNHSWRVAVESGTARFRLTAEDWRLVLEVPGADDHSMRVTVTEPAETETAEIVTVEWKPEG